MIDQQRVVCNYSERKSRTGVRRVCRAPIETEKGFETEMKVQDQSSGPNSIKNQWQTLHYTMGMFRFFLPAAES